MGSIFGRSTIARHAPLVAALLLAMSAGAAYAAEGDASGPSESIFILQVLALLVGGRLLGEAMQRVGQPAVIGQLLAGIVLGPSLLGALAPQLQHALFPPHAPAQKAMLDAVSQLGILMLLLLTGMETDLAFVRKVRGAAASVSLSGIVLPFVCGFALGELLPASMLPHPEQRLVTSLFLGTALSISSVKIVAMVVREMNFTRRNLGQMIVASAIIDDTVGWLIIAMTFSIAMHGSLDLASLARSVAGTVAFLAASFTLGRRFVFFAIRWTNDTFVSDVPVITAILVIMMGMALLTDWIGVHSVLGAFVAGMLVGQSPILTKHIEGQLRGLITALFMPVFFGTAGLGADLTILKDLHIAGLTLGLIAIATIGKFSGAFIGGWMGGYSRAECIALGCAMNARGSTEVIVATIGLSIGAVSQDLYTMIVAMAVTTTLCMPPMLRWALVRLPMPDDERKRLEREAADEKGFLANVERILLTVDDSAKGKFASRLVGLLAGERGTAVTVLHHGEAGDTSAESEGSRIVQAAASRERTAADSEDAPDEVAVLTKPAAAAAPGHVSTEASKGYDLLVIGLEPTGSGDGGGLDEGVKNVAAQFDGPIVLTTARGTLEGAPLDGAIDILLPVSGTRVSRRSAEVALTLAKAGGGRVLALYIATEREREHARRRGRRMQTGQRVLGEIATLAEQMDVKIASAIRIDVDPEDAILRQARLGRYSLIVMGVERQSEDAFELGYVPTALLDASDRSLVFVTD